MNKQAFDLIVKRANEALHPLVVAERQQQIKTAGLYEWAGRNPRLAAILAGGAAGGLYGLAQRPPIEAGTGRTRGRWSNALGYGGAGLLGGAVGAYALPNFALKGISDSLPRAIREAVYLGR